MSVACQWTCLTDWRTPRPNFLPMLARQPPCTRTTFFKSTYVTTIHKLQAVKLGLLTQTQMEEITAGRKPSDLDKERSVAYDVAEHLLAVRGSLPDELYERSLKTFGKEGTVALMHLVSLMAWTSMGLNVADVQPERLKSGFFDVQKHS